MNFTLFTPKGRTFQRARIGAWTTPFPQLAGLLPNGTYAVHALPLKRKPLLKLVKDDRVDRPLDMMNYSIEMAFPHTGASYATHIALCEDALLALFSNTIPDAIYLYRVRTPRKN